MKRFRLFAILLSAVVLAAVSCTGEGLEKQYDKSTGYKNVVVVYSLGFNNLSSVLESNIEEMKEGEVPERNDGNVLIVLSHRTESPNNFTTKTEPRLYRLYKKDGTVIREPLVTYPSTSISASAEMLTEVLSYIKEEFPAQSYGMVFSSHGTGWLPATYDLNPEKTSYSNSLLEFESYSPSNDPYVGVPITKSVGMHATSIDFRFSYHAIDIDDFADALPMHFEYIVFDACLMGAVEVAYQLRNSCDYLVVSPTEVLAKGFEYGGMLHNLYTHDLVAVAKDYINKYDGSHASVSIVDCNGLGELAEVCEKIVSNHKDGLANIDRSATQAYFYDDKVWYYDLRDIMVNIGADSKELSSLDEVMGRCILYKDHTPKFFNLELKRVSGLSMYIPIKTSVKLNGFYSGLDWNEAICLVD